MAKPPDDEPTVPRSDRPLPPHDPLPVEAHAEGVTERAPATLDEIRDMLGTLITRVDALTTAVEETNLRQAAIAIEHNKQVASAVAAARDAANGALEAAARVEALRKAIDDQFGTNAKASGG